MAEGHGSLGKRVRGPNFVYRRSKFQQKKRDKEEKEKEFKQRIRRGGSLTKEESDRDLGFGEELPGIRRVGKGHVGAKRPHNQSSGPVLSDWKRMQKKDRKKNRKVGKGYVISKNRSKKKK